MNLRKTVCKHQPHDESMYLLLLACGTTLPRTQHCMQYNEQRSGVNASMQLRQPCAMHACVAEHAANMMLRVMKVTLSTACLWTQALRRAS